MGKDFYISNLDATNLNLHFCGYEDCEPGHSYGPAIRDHYLFVYIKSGKGTVKIKDKTYSLKEFDSFTLFPDNLSFYEADKEEPWQYVWIGFFGDSAGKYLQHGGITPESPIHHHSNPIAIEQIFEKLFQFAQNEKYDSEIASIGLLHLLIALIIKDAYPKNQKDLSTDQKQVYINKATHFIDLNYAEDISTSKISEHVGLERSYFSKLFKQYMKQTPHDYLTNKRIEKGLELLANTDMTIEHIAYSVGFEYPLYFSRVFKKLKGIPPSQFRERLDTPEV